jgi:hypothetical protein
LSINDESDKVAEEVGMSKFTSEFRADPGSGQSSDTGILGRTVIARKVIILLHPLNLVFLALLVCLRKGRSKHGRQTDRSSIISTKNECVTSAGRCFDLEPTDKDILSLAVENLILDRR